MILSCVCLPDAQSSEKIRKIMEEVSAECDSVNALSFPPHFSIRGDFEVEDKKLPLMLNSIAGVTKRFSSISLNLNKYGFYPWKIIYLDIDKTDELNRLHSDLMVAIQECRTCWVPEALLKSEHFSGRQKEYIQKYGYQFAFEYYSPHFTLAGNDMTQEKFEEVKKHLESEKVALSMVINEVALFDRDSGNRVFQSFTLGG